MHGNAVAALACHSEFILSTNFTNFTNVYRCAIGFSPTDNTDFIDFFLIIRFALLLCKNRSVDLHRFYRCAMFFLPTNFTNITNVYRCAIGFSPTDYTDFIDFLFSLYDSLFCFAKIALRICTDFIAARCFFSPTNFTNITNIYCYVIVFFCRFY